MHCPEKENEREKVPSSGVFSSCTLFSLDPSDRDFGHIHTQVSDVFVKYLNCGQLCEIQLF